MEREREREKNNNDIKFLIFFFFRKILIKIFTYIDILKMNKACGYFYDFLLVEAYLFLLKLFAQRLSLNLIYI